MLAAMGADRLRALAIVCFAAGGVAAGLGNSRHENWLIGVAFAAFVGGAFVYFRWRATLRARVFDQEDKTKTST
jgi:hypothetical protein